MTHPSYDADIKRLNRIAGQIEGIKKMIQDGRYCPEILTQLRAVRSAVKGVETEILRRHLSSCVARAMESGDEAARAKSIREVADLFAKFDD